MTTNPEPAIPDRVEAWIREDGGDLALLLISLDAAQRPHVMMLARDEIRVMSPTGLRVALGEQSRSAENLRLRRAATLAIYDAGLACVIKTRVVAGPRTLLKGIVACDLAVQEFRFDSPTAAERSARLVTGLRFEGRAERHDIREALARPAAGSGPGSG
ncbi:MAG: hypothetical protein JJE39_04710 [Vicinamibacteria bacterium]|nr:hypothetical protein [Vicinamibacteria bacterium]